MRFEVPQFIEIEDKIFGPLSWRQFLYLGGGLGLAAVLFFTGNLFLFVLFGIPAGALAGALAFYPVNNRPFSYFLEAIFNYVTGKRLYLWRQKKDIVYRNRTSLSEQRRSATVAQPRDPSRIGKKIASLSRRMEL